MMKLPSTLNVNLTTFEQILFTIRKAYVKTVIAISYKKRIQIYRDLTSHIRSTDVDDALTTLQKESEALKALELLVYEEVQLALRDQKSFYVAISEWVPKNEALQIYVSKQGRDVDSDSLPKSLEAARRICEQKAELFSMYSTKLAYPIVMAFLALGLFFAFKLFAYDFLTSIKPFNNWPLETQEQYNSIAFFTNNIHIFSLLAIACIFSIKVFMTKGHGRLRSFMNAVPPFSIYQSITSYTVLMSLASLTRSGVHLTEALRLITSSLDGWASVELKGIIERLERPEKLPEGKTLTEYAFNSQLFTNLVRVKVGSYARRKDFVENLEYLNTVLLHDVSSESLKSAAILGALVIFAVLAFVVQIALIFISALLGDASSY